MGRILGVDLTHGKKRRLVAFRGRQNKAKLRLGRISRMVNVASTTNALASSGAWPQAKWVGGGFGHGPQYAESY